MSEGINSDEFCETVRKELQDRMILDGVHLWVRVESDPLYGTVIRIRLYDAYANCEQWIPIEKSLHAGFYDWIVRELVTSWALQKYVRK